MTVRPFLAALYPRPFALPARPSRPRRSLRPRTLLVALTAWLATSAGR